VLSPDDASAANANAAAARHEPRVLVYDPDRSQGLVIAGALRAALRGAIVTLVAERAGYRDLTGVVDVALLNLATDRFDGLAAGAELAALFPWIETVFWFDEATGGPAAEAARSLGIKRLIPFVCVGDWLAAALPQLARMARARREHASAENDLPPLPQRAPCETAWPLPEAERRFREAYLRRILAETASPALAARKAGLPYTTFRSMLKKMDIR
jgi:hypothetical protein